MIREVLQKAKNNKIKILGATASEYRENKLPAIHSPI